MKLKYLIPSALFATFGLAALYFIGGGFTRHKSTLADFDSAAWKAGAEYDNRSIRRRDANKVLNGLIYKDQAAEAVTALLGPADRSYPCKGEACPDDKSEIWNYYLGRSDYGIDEEFIRIQIDGNRRVAEFYWTRY